MDPPLQAFLAAAASFIAVILIFTALYIFFRDPDKRRRTEQTRNHHPRTRNTRTVVSTNTDLSSITVTESATFDPSLSRISMRELADATRDFSPELIIGDGSFGMVYKAKLNSGVSVAVKKLSADAFQGFREYRAEMETLGRRPNFPFTGEDGHEIRLVNWVSSMVEQERYMEMVDVNLSRDDLKESAIVEYFKIAMMCANENYHVRPPMNEDLESSRSRSGRFVSVSDPGLQLPFDLKNFCERV
ncbi:hypothetical protein K7X08_014484 [Anisodus acutangulus]|uniref:Protein kinase domain-containing protein n=1 Tax=Anisodus acutangulus TaxID=402998 RepID=A0A9Q1LLP7_9SOLA|nr:hypothetical protein K7X08_014484 [Anisodus acutangulus]